MLNVEDLIIYPGHGICKIDDICNKTYGGITRSYYILHPIENDQNLTINVPVENGKDDMLKLINKEEAEEIIALFYSDGIDWIEKPQLRARVFSDIVKNGDRVEIVKVAITLMQKKVEIEKADRKFYEHDSKLLTNIEDILFKELSLALNTSPEAINQMINNIIRDKGKLPNN